MASVTDIANQIHNNMDNILSLLEEVKEKFASLHPQAIIEINSAIKYVEDSRTAAISIIAQSQTPLTNIEQFEAYNNNNLYQGIENFDQQQYSFPNNFTEYRPSTSQFDSRIGYINENPTQIDSYEDWSSMILQGEDVIPTIPGFTNIMTQTPTFPSQPLQQIQPQPSIPQQVQSGLSSPFPEDNFDMFSSVDALETEELPADPFSILNEQSSKQNELPEDVYEDVSNLFDTAIFDDFDDNEIKVASVPFAVDVICIEEDGENSSMYADCLDENIGEWEADAILSENAFKVVEFSFEGPLDGGDICTVVWRSKDNKLVARSPLSYKIGALTQAAQAHGLFTNDIKTSFSDIEIVEYLAAFAPDEALSKLPLMDIDKIAIIFEYKDVEYTMYMKTANADIQFEWEQTPEITATVLADMLQFVSVSLDIYKVSKDNLEDVSRDLDESEDDITKAEYYHRYENSYNIMKAKHRVRNAELDIESFSVVDGNCIINRCSQNAS